MLWLGIAQSVELSTHELKSPVNHCATVGKLLTPPSTLGSLLILVVNYVGESSLTVVDMNASSCATQVHALHAPNS